MCSRNTDYEAMHSSLVVVIIIEEFIVRLLHGEHRCITWVINSNQQTLKAKLNQNGPMPNVMATQPNIGGAMI